MLSEKKLKTASNWDLMLTRYLIYMICSSLTAKASNEITEINQTDRWFVDMVGTQQSTQWCRICIVWQWLACFSNRTLEGHTKRLSWEFSPDMIFPPDPSNPASLSISSTAESLHFCSFHITHITRHLGNEPNCTRRTRTQQVLMRASPQLRRRLSSLHHHHHHRRSVLSRV